MQSEQVSVRRSQAAPYNGSTVVTMTSKVDGKTEILNPCRSETPENIEDKIGVNDYVMDP